MFIIRWSIIITLILQSSRISTIDAHSLLSPSLSVAHEPSQLWGMISHPSNFPKIGNRRTKSIDKNEKHLQQTKDPVEVSTSIPTQMSLDLISSTPSVMDITYNLYSNVPTVRSLIPSKLPPKKISTSTAVPANCIDGTAVQIGRAHV